MQFQDSFPFIHSKHLMQNADGPKRIGSTKPKKKTIKLHKRILICFLPQNRIDQFLFSKPFEIFFIKYEGMAINELQR